MNGIQRSIRSINRRFCAIHRTVQLSSLRTRNQFTRRHFQVAFAKITTSQIMLGEFPDTDVVDYPPDSFYPPERGYIAINLRLAVGKAAQYNPVLLKMDAYIEIIHITARNQRSFNPGGENRIICPHTDRWRRGDRTNVLRIIASRYGHR
jgi:hypothetical protein